MTGHLCFPANWTLLVIVACVAAPAVGHEDGNGGVRITGELKQWHKVTLSLDGPPARERDEDLNPFTDYRMTVVFEHESGTPRYEVPGYFAADGDAANSSAEEGNVWRAHLSPDKPGTWRYRVSFVKGKNAALGDAERESAVAPYDGVSGTFEIAPTDKTGRDLRGKGRLEYVGKHYLQFAGTGEYFLKAGPDAPETLLAYKDFDGTETRGAPLKSWSPHVKDWRPGDPSWKDGRGKGLIGALNYLSAKGCNAFSFLPYNAGGDGDNVWPFVARDDKLHYDCSKLDQWQIVFDHAQPLGLYLHFKLQETENDDNTRGGAGKQGGKVPAALDGGDLGVERKLYCRELIARFGHELALNWNLGEENTQTPDQQRAMARYLREVDPYDHHIVVHTYPGAQDKVYPPLLGEKSVLTGASLQNSWSQAHERTSKWVAESARAGRPWVVANDEQNPASHGVPPDPGYQGHDGFALQGDKKYNLHDIRKHCLWGTLTAGGMGVEYYFGYQLPENDLLCEDFRSRDKSWDYCRIALGFFGEHGIPFHEMQCRDDLVGAAPRDNRRYCFAKPGEVYLVYLPTGGEAELNLQDASGAYTVAWFKPREGGPLEKGEVNTISGGQTSSLGAPPSDPKEDWLVVVRRRK
ncbi:MAG: DUF5060 domain-containing protein [Planctomycetes bacterium]|nr:DUF5060 domain-containing protein [Planctomycetota bacterium]